MAGEKTNIFATIELPDEFIALCADNMVTPETMLRTFISDVSGIINWAKDPRKDGYSSGGSDERDMAKRYMNRCSYAFFAQQGNGDEEGFARWLNTWTRQNGGRREVLKRVFLSLVHNSAAKNLWEEAIADYLCKNCAACLTHVDGIKLAFFGKPSEDKDCDLCDSPAEAFVSTVFGEDSNRRNAKLSASDAASAAWEDASNGNP